jgi:putative NADPH-quinone reductase
MNVLVVHAHPEPKSFNGALTRAAIRALREHGHTVEVSDLYAMKWKSAADADDYAGRTTAARRAATVRLPASHLRLTDPTGPLSADSNDRVDQNSVARR